MKWPLGFNLIHCYCVEREWLSCGLKLPLCIFFNGDGTFHPCQPLRSLMGSTACLYRGPNMKSSSVFSSKCTFPGYFLENVPNDSGKPLIFLLPHTGLSDDLFLCLVFLGVSSSEFFFYQLEMWVTPCPSLAWPCVWDEHKELWTCGECFLSQLWSFSLSSHPRRSRSFWQISSSWESAVWV